MKPRSRGVRLRTCWKSVASGQASKQSALCRFNAPSKTQRKNASRQPRRQHCQAASKQTSPKGTPVNSTALCSHTGESTTASATGQRTPASGKLPRRIDLQQHQRGERQQQVEAERAGNRNYR